MSYKQMEVNGWLISLLKVRGGSRGSYVVASVGI